MRVILSTAAVCKRPEFDIDLVTFKERDSSLWGIGVLDNLRRAKEIGGFELTGTQGTVVCDLLQQQGGIVPIVNANEKAILHQLIGRVGTATLQGVLRPDFDETRVVDNAQVQGVSDDNVRFRALLYRR